MRRSTLPLGALAGLSCLFAACVTSTGGVPISLRLAFEPLGSSRFETFTGWRVELEEARALVGPLYAHAPEREALARAWLGPSRAFAHGGHGLLDARALRAELLEPRVVDALRGDPGLALDGLAGAVDTLTLVLHAPTERDGPTPGASVWVRGVARREGAEVRFEGGLAIADARQRRVEGVAVSGPPLEEGSSLWVGLDVGAWLAEADFADLATEGLVRLEGTQPERALRLGARGAASWSGRIEPAGPNE